MVAKDIYITQWDRDHLNQRIQSLLKGSRRKAAAHLATLRDALEHATIVQNAESIPEDIVSLNSVVRVTNLDSGHEMVFTLVYPSVSCPAEGKLSVLGCLGTAVLGCRAGDTVDWQGPKGPCHVRVEEILARPETSGDKAAPKSMA
ncbi:MAG: GreA/GreB family elongation factor [Candidatus Hydrogenedentes bacterium]|nr:GreA/GreB family elongation factor [Candidatus Hydrogenedentota bacterium]